jgi:hypothetical protein
MRLQLGNMHHVVNMSMHRQIKFVRHSTHPLQDSVRVEEAKQELLTASWHKQHLNVWLYIQIHQVANLELSLQAMLVSLSFHSLLGASELLLQHGSELLPIAEPFTQIWDGAGIHVSNTEMTRRVAIQYLKRGMTQRCMIRHVIPELRQWKPMEPFTGGCVHRAPQICFQALVQSLCLAIRLWMIR